MRIILLLVILFMQISAQASNQRFDILLGQQYRQFNTNSVESEQVGQTNISLAYSIREFRGVFDWTSEYSTTTKEAGFKITSREKDLALWGQWNPLYRNKYVRPWEPFVSIGLGLRQVVVDSAFQGITSKDKSSGDNYFYGAGAGLRLPIQMALFSLEGRYLMGPAIQNQNEFVLMLGVGMNIPTLSKK